MATAKFDRIASANKADDPLKFDAVVLIVNVDLDRLKRAVAPVELLMGDAFHSLEAAVDDSINAGSLTLAEYSDHFRDDFFSETNTIFPPFEAMVDEKLPKVDPDPRVFYDHSRAATWDLIHNITIEACLQTGDRDLLVQLEQLAVYMQEAVKSAPTSEIQAKTNDFYEEADLRHANFTQDVDERIRSLFDDVTNGATEDNSLWSEVVDSASGSGSSTTDEESSSEDTMDASSVDGQDEV